MALSFEALRRVLRHVGELALLRADLAAEELALARRRWLGWAVTALLGVALLTVAVIAASAWLTLLLWDRFGAGTLLALAALYTLMGVALLRALAKSAGGAPSPLARTRAAIHEDYDALASMASASRESEPKA